MYAQRTTLIWWDFIERLCGPDCCNWQESSWTCFGDHRFSRRILGDMGFSTSAVETYLAYFKTEGGYCDCEVVLNVDPRRPAIKRARRGPAPARGRR